MPEILDSGRIARGFSKAARTYDRWAEAQKIIAERLVAVLPGNLQADGILDVGCGTGILTALLKDRFRPRRLCGIDIAPAMIQRCRRRWPRFRFLRTDAEKFDAPDRYDLIASNCAWQWFADRRRAAANLGRLLAADGLLALAAPVRGSFPELDRASREATGRVPSSLQLSEPAEYLDSFPAAGWEPLSARVELIRADYATPWDVLRSFKGIGALYRPADYRPYTIKQLADLCRSYQRQHNPDQTVPLTYRVLFLVLRKKGGG